MKSFLIGAFLTLLASAVAADKKLVLIAGGPSHGPGEHEHRAGCLLLQQCLAGIPGIQTVVYDNGWPGKEQDGKRVDDNDALENADAVVIYSDGGRNHPALVRDHLEVLQRLIKKGAGFGTIHYATEPTKEKGEAEFIEWIGGAFEVDWSVNPVWKAEFNHFPKHPITRGVKPFTARDEWYFHLRFRPDMKGITPLLVTIPPASTMSRPDGEHSGNPAVRAAVANGEGQTVMWAAERPNGLRGFGFTGGHYHTGWGNENQRKIVLNALLWIAHVPVPETGVDSKVSEADLQANLDRKTKRKP